VGSGLLRAAPVGNEPALATDCCLSHEIESRLGVLSANGKFLLTPEVETRVLLIRVDAVGTRSLRSDMFEWSLSGS
jgi:hypothetical protein